MRGARVPLPWSGVAQPFGFSESSSSWLPMPPEWGAMTVAAQEPDPASTLSFYRAALAARRATPALAGAELRWIDGPADVVVFRREGAGDAPLWCAVLPPDTAVWISGTR